MGSALVDRARVGRLHEGWHPTTLVKFRARLLLHVCETLALENTLRLAEEILCSTVTVGADHRLHAVAGLGGLAVHRPAGSPRRPLTSSTPSFPSMPSLRAFGLRAGVCLRLARTRNPTAAGANGPNANGCSRAWPQDAERALRAVEHADGLLGDGRVADAHRLLRELIGQDFDTDDDRIPRLHRGHSRPPDHLDRRHRDASLPKELRRRSLTATSSPPRRPTRACRLSPRLFAPAGETDGPCLASHLRSARCRLLALSWAMLPTATAGPRRARLLDI